MTDRLTPHDIRDPSTPSDQTYDADLDTWATVTPSSAGKALVAAGNYTAMRTLLSLTPGTDIQEYSAGTVLNVRLRNTIAEINAGKTLLAAVAGKSYRILNVKAIAYGGAVGATTTVDILGTQTTGVKLVTFAQADLAQSVVLSDVVDGTVLADGASYTACDVNTAITIGKTGSDLTTATGVDIILTYVIE